MTTYVQNCSIQNAAQTLNELDFIVGLKYIKSDEWPPKGRTWKQMTHSLLDYPGPYSFQAGCCLGCSVLLETFLQGLSQKMALSVWWSEYFNGSSWNVMLTFAFSFSKSIIRLCRDCIVARNLMLSSSKVLCCMIRHMALWVAGARYVRIHYTFDLATFVVEATPEFTVFSSVSFSRISNASESNTRTGASMSCSTQI